MPPLQFRGGGVTDNSVTLNDEVQDGASAKPSVPLAEAVAVGDPDEVLGTFKELFPNESLRRGLNFRGWQDDQQLTRKDLASYPMIFIQDADFVIGTKDAQSLGYLTGLSMDLHVMGKYSNPMKDQSWRIEDMDAFWSSVANWKDIPSFSMLYPEWKDGANQSLNLKFPLMPKVSAMQLSGWSRSSSLANPITKVFNGSDIKPENLPALTSLRWEDVALDDWTSLGGLTGLTQLEITGGGMKDASFISNLKNLKQVNLAGNALLDFTPLQPLIEGGQLAPNKLNLSGQDRYIAGKEAFTMWGDMDEISIPISVVAPDGTKMGADAFTGTKVEGNKLVALNKGELPQGVRYDEATQSFILTREAAKALPRVKPSCLGFEANMFIIKFACPIPGFDEATGQVWVEINVTDDVQAKPIDHVPVINAVDLTLTVGDKFDPEAGVTATDNEDGELKFIVEKNDVDASKPGTYQVTYMATDSIGSVARKTITVTVKAKPVPAPEQPQGPQQPQQPQEPTQPQKPQVEQDERPALPATGDPSALAMGATAAMGILSLGAACFKRRRF